jgi:hypothetical protein
VGRGDSYKPATRFDTWKKMHPRAWKRTRIGLAICVAVIAPVVLGAAVFFGFKVLLVLLEVFYTALGLYEP